MLTRAIEVLKSLLHWLGDDPHPASHKEKWLSAAGGFLGILGMLAVCYSALDTWGTALVITSMGSSAVLLFAVPHSPMAQPWPVFGGNLISAAVGITCAKLFGDTVLAASLAVALAIAAMYYTRCLHAPGGAAALAVVMGGPSVHALGYGYLVTPILINVVMLLTITVLFNAPFRHRRYPRRLAELAAAVAAPPSQPAAPPPEKAMIAHSDLVYALSQIDSFIDVTEEDLLRIYDLAMHHHLDEESRHMRPLAVPVAG